MRKQMCCPSQMWALGMCLGWLTASRLWAMWPTETNQSTRFLPISTTRGLVEAPPAFTLSSLDSRRTYAQLCALAMCTAGRRVLQSGRAAWCRQALSCRDSRHTQIAHFKALSKLNTERCLPKCLARSGREQRWLVVSVGWHASLEALPRKAWQWNRITQYVLFGFKFHMFQDKLSVQN